MRASRSPGVQGICPGLSFSLLSTELALIFRRGQRRQQLGSPLKMGRLVSLAHLLAIRQSVSRSLYDKVPAASELQLRVVVSSV